MAILNAASTVRNAMNSLSPSIQTKLEDLCRAILAEPAMEQHRLRVDQFMINDAAREQYVKVSEQGEHLHHKQHQGVQLTDAEISAFEQEREKLLSDPVARGFLDAQEALHEVQETVNKFLKKSLELGRVPAAEDLQGGCGSGCGCHHNH